MRKPLPKIRTPSWIDRIPRVSFLEIFEKYRRRMVHERTMLPFDPSEAEPVPYTIEKLAFDTGWGLRLALKLFPGGCVLVFLLSYVFESYVLAEHPWVSEVLRSSSVAGLIGFGTNWVAIKMLFWPRQMRPLFGQGLIPAQRAQLIQKVADEVLENLINEELIEQKIEETQIVSRFSGAFIEKLQRVVREPEFKGDLRNMILTYVGDLTSDEAFRKNLGAKAEASLEEFGGTKLKGWVVKKLKDVWRAPLIELLNREIERLDDTVDGGLEHLDEALERLPKALDDRQEQIDHVLTTMLMGLVREVDVRAIVVEQLSTVTTEQLERGFREFSDDKLSFITLLGGILGVVGGTVLVWPLPSMAVLLVLGALVVAADFAVYPLMGTRFWPKRRRQKALADRARAERDAPR
ncbi:MAG TPA: DUF445 family protein [Sandaracinaceae bacterium LLY-WYZ-13_1]|nr:DUF445 family protein [Sandaracinaceae bacterium LLY-WYZ-13_1]